jgi:hypothetical protein
VVAVVAGGTLATLEPDGTRLLVQYDEDLLVVLDAATLPPLARLPLDIDAALVDWRPAPGD